MNTANLTQVAQSVSIVLGPYDAKCRYWTKLIRADVGLPLPMDVSCADDIPVPYQRRGDEELYPDDILIEGEARHPRHHRGWVYWVHFVNPEGRLVTYRSGFGDQKQAAKELGLAKELLAGAGDHAGAIRIAHALREGMKLPGAVKSRWQS